MIAGETVIQTLYLYDASGALVSYATKAAMVAALWDLTWYDNTGVALASQPTWTLPVAGASGRHQIAFVMPEGVWTCKVSLPAAANVAAPAEFGDEGTAYDIDSVGSQIATSNGVSLTPITTGDAQTIYDGDSIITDFAISEAALAYIGAASLAAVTVGNMVPAIKLDSVDSDQPQTALMTPTITSDVLNTRTVRGTLAAFPAALAVPDATKSVSATIQLRLTYSGKTCIATAVALTVLWKAPTA